MIVIVGPKTENDQIALRLLQLGVTDVGRLSIIRYGTLTKSHIDEWVGIDPPIGSGELGVNLVAPDPGDREPSLQWGYIRRSGGKDFLSYEPEVAVSCYCHTDLVAISIDAPIATSPSAI